MRKLLFLLSALMLFVRMAYAQTPAKDAIIGEWLVEEQTARIKITKVGDRYYGAISWLKEPVENGKPQVDKNNPDPAKRTNPLLGLQLLQHFKYDEDNTWSDGTIYDSRDGKAYSCNITLLDKNKLKVRGYIGFSLLGKTTYWTRVN
jgi:uncharacterized protein (DUF2147 family)